MNTEVRNHIKKNKTAGEKSLLGDFFSPLTQKSDAQTVCELPGPVRAEDVSLVVTVGTLEDAHVLHQTENLQEKQQLKLTV